MGRPVCSMTQAPRFSSGTNSNGRSFGACSTILTALPLATNPDFYTIAYINCSAEVKALSDCIVTSGNAVKIVEHAPKDRPLLFVPDENLGAWVIEQTGRPMTLWKGNCYVHVEWTHQAITRIRQQFPGAPVVAHPECTRSVRMLADEVCSTEKMITWCRKTSAKDIIIATEAGMLHRLQKSAPTSISSRHRRSVVPATSVIS